MKIISQTNSEILISAPKQTFIEKIVFFIIFFNLGGFIVFLVSALVLMPLNEIGILRISCDRVEPQQVDCQISKSKYLDFVQQEPLDYKFVNSVKYNVITSKDSDGDTVYRYNFSLVTKSGEKVPFEESFYKSTANSVVSALNPFLQSKQESFRYTLDGRSDPQVFGNYLSILILPIFIFCGLSVIWAAFSVFVDYEEILLDKSKYQLKHSKRTLLGTKVNHFSFNEIAKADVLYATDSYKKVYFTPRIAIDSKLQFTLDTISDRQVAIKVANDLNRFMCLPEEEDPVVKE